MQKSVGTFVVKLDMKYHIFGGNDSSIINLIENNEYRFWEWNLFIAVPVCFTSTFIKMGNKN
jgi:hypothetical protein